MKISNTKLSINDFLSFCSCFDFKNYIVKTTPSANGSTDIIQWKDFVIARTVVRHNRVDWQRVAHPGFFFTTFSHLRHDYIEVVTLYRLYLISNPLIKYEFSVSSDHFCYAEKGSEEAHKLLYSLFNEALILNEVKK